MCSCFCFILSFWNLIGAHWGLVILFSLHCGETRRFHDFNNCITTFIFILYSETARERLAPLLFFTSLSYSYLLPCHCGVLCAGKISLSDFPHHSFLFSYIHPLLKPLIFKKILVIIFFISKISNKSFT